MFQRLAIQQLKKVNDCCTCDFATPLSCFYGSAYAMMVIARWNCTGSAMLDLMLKFGPFQLFPERRLLLNGGKPVAVSSRALEILIVLLEKNGDVVSKKELMARVWPGTLVVDASLRVHLVALRKALRDGRGEGSEASYIGNVSGRGYRFIEPIIRLAPDAQRPTAMSSLPAPILRLIGRDDAVAALVRELPARRPASCWRRAIRTAPASSTSARCRTRHWCRPRWPRRSACRCCPRPAYASCCNTWAASRCCCCSITANIWSAAWPRWSRRCCATVPACMCWPPAASRSASRVSGCTACRRWARRPSRIRR